MDRRLQVALKAGMEVLKRLPAGCADAARYHAFLQWFVNKVQLMQPGHLILLPGGWLTPPSKVRLLWPCASQPRPAVYRRILDTSLFFDGCRSEKHHNRRAAHQDYIQARIFSPVVFDSQAEKEAGLAGGAGSHVLIHVLTREPDSSFSFATVNTGAEQGLQYHPASVRLPRAGREHSLTLLQVRVACVPASGSAFAWWLG